MIIELTPQISKALDTLESLHPNETRENLTRYMFILAFYQMIKDFGEVSSVQLSYLTSITVENESSII